jgi:protoporphyrinogen oxidase
LGGGPAGLSLAYYAAKQGMPFKLFEMSSELGGLCRTLRWGEHRYDCGAHRFHDKDPQSTKDVRDLMGSELHRVTAPSKVYVAGRFVEFPPTPISILRWAKPAQIAAILSDLVAARWKRKPELSFADFAANTFGPTLARLFLLNYTEKVWGLPADQLSPDVATRRLSGMSLSSLFVELFSPSRRTSHIDGHFLYPRLGYGQIVETLAASLPGELLRTKHKVVSLGLAGEEIRKIRCSNGVEISQPGLVLSTLPLTALVRLLEPYLPEKAMDAARSLRFREVRLIYLRLNRPRFTENASIYIPNADLCVSRISEPKNRSSEMAPSSETGLLVEVPCFPETELSGMSDEALHRRVVDELSGIGLLNPGELVASRHHRLPDAYPVYALGYSEKTDLVLKSLKTIRNLHTFGRNGQFFYSHLHDQMRWARDLVDCLATSEDGRIADLTGRLSA